MVFKIKLEDAVFRGADVGVYENDADKAGGMSRETGGIIAVIGSAGHHMGCLPGVSVNSTETIKLF